METSVAFFSHHLETLLEYFMRDIYAHQKGPFEKKMVVIPHLSMKSYLLSHLSQRLGVAAGLKIVTLSQAVDTLLSSKEGDLPKFLELSLAIQHEIIGLLEEKNEVISPLVHYLSGASFSLKITQLSDLLSLTFLNYSEYGGAFLKPWLEEDGWQQQIWKKLFVSRFGCHSQKLLQKIATPYTLYLFGFHFLPDLYLHFFKNLNSTFYFFSPCKEFWADRYSQKESLRLKEKALPLEGNPLLANWGKLGRKFFISLLDQDLNIKEEYPENTQANQLEMVQQAIVEDSPRSVISADGSIQLISAPSKLKEIEILYQALLPLLEKNCFKPHQIAVFAPDIEVYAPFIKAVFSDSSLSFSIFNLEQISLCPLMQAFKLLLELPNEKFSREALLKLFATQSFRDKFHLSSEDIGLIQFWTEQAHVRWGLDEMQRTMLFQGLKLEDGAIGTWEKGMERLLRGIATAEDSLIQLSEIELFNKLLCILRSLKEDLKPLLDGKKQLIPEWIAYFQKLLSSYFYQPSDGLIQDLYRLQSATFHLNRHPVNYDSIKRLLFSFFKKKSGTFQESHLHGVKFYSIASGGVFPCELIYLIGMQEGTFPRKKKQSLSDPLFDQKGSFCPSQAEEDRFLFLQLLLSARKYLFFSYQRISEEDQKILNPTYLIEELQSYLQLNCVHYSDSAPKEASAASCFLPEWYQNMELQAPHGDLHISLDRLAAFAKHPLRFYFHKVLQMGVALFEKNEEEEEFILSSLFKKSLREKSLKQPLDELLQKIEHRGQLPRGLFKTVALQTMQAEVEDLNAHFEFFGFSKESISKENISFKMALKNGTTATIEGMLDGIGPEGFVYHGENKIDDLVTLWPLFLVYLHGVKTSKPTIFFTKAKESQTFALKEASLQKYIEYYQLAHHFASPLIPKLAKPLLQGTKEELEKKLEELIYSEFAQDSALKWLFDRDKMPNSDAIFHNWASILREVHEPIL